ncbi:glutamyl-tRNA reductase [Tessaracoccus antarcticus]|uniref:glutamyl-tRNA reductase n=1 Tax=Tessaracoccus antarcticus TaxID=2479848 RepID=UPI00131424CA|nr:glutamyl-tRNA reductase [Tessaracoccus antarcticus]
MNLRIFSIQHDTHGLAEVQRASENAPLLADQLREIRDVDGVVVLATCNRVEVLLDAPTLTTAHARLRLSRVGAAPMAWDVREGDEALTHLFRVAAGLESMVVGEREIAGQLRRALNDAQDNGHASPSVTLCVEEALRTSRRIARETSLHAAGRSVVSEGLDMLGPLDWASQRVLVVGTGSFAGAVVSAVRSRGARNLRVHSSSGRGPRFAESHQMVCVDDLPRALHDADVIVTCRGTGGHTITADMLACPRPVAVIDLSLSRDVAPEVAALPHVTAVDLALIQRDVAPRWDRDTEHAAALVSEGVEGALARMRSRLVDPAVVELRQAVLELVADEVERLPRGRSLDRDECAHALRRLATRLLHTPSMRAREAAEAGRSEEYLSALNEVYGISAAAPSPELNPDDLESQHCPVTGLALSDLDPRPRLEAM